MTTVPALPIAITIGDPNGIGPEIAVRAAAHFAHIGGPRVVIVGDVAVVEHYQRKCAPQLDIISYARDNDVRNAIELQNVPALTPGKFQPGVVDAAAGAATVAYLKAALTLTRDGQARAIVGAPHSETAIHAAGISFSGYPSLLARLTDVPEDRVFLMLVGGGLRILHATLHERLQDALQRLSAELVEASIIAADAVLKDMGIERPHIGIFGINPHAGEGGLFGSDDDDVTAPVVSKLRQAGINISGPIGADLLLARKDIDAFVAMYHDQGHIPVKLLAGRKASALSVGAGVIFSSVGHGAAFDIAGKGTAEPEAVIRTVELLDAVKGNGSERTTEKAA